MFLGLRTVIYPTPDLDAAKAFFTPLLGVEPYFDEPFYVGYQVGGYELALHPSADIDLGPVTYWGVGDADSALAQLVAGGASVRDLVRDVGDGIRVATVNVPGGVLGVMENPHFQIQTVASDGPGR